MSVRIKSSLYTRVARLSPVNRDLSGFVRVYPMGMERLKNRLHLTMNDKRSSVEGNQFYGLIKNCNFIVGWRLIFTSFFILYFYCTFSLQL